MRRGKRLKRHRFACGLTGSGKTWYATKLYKELGGINIFINTQFERIVEDNSQVITENLNDVFKAIEEKKGRVSFQPTGSVVDICDDVYYLWYALRELGRKLTEKKITVWCHLFVDEVHQYGGRLDELWRQSRRFGITLIGISQRPASTSHTILTQSPDHIIFKCGTYELPYFQRYRIPIEEFQDWLERDYHYVKFDLSGEITKYQPVRL